LKTLIDSFDFFNNALPDSILHWAGNQKHPTQTELLLSPTEFFLPGCTMPISKYRLPFQQLINLLILTLSLFFGQ
jgi:hypothetical protein